MKTVNRGTPNQVKWKKNRKLNLMSAGGNFLGGDILMCPADCRRIMNFLNGL